LTFILNLLSFDSCGPIYQEFPAWFKRHGYKNPNDAYNTVFQEACNTKENCFEWMMSHPENFANFNVYMAARRENQTTWIQKYPVLEDLNPNDPMLTADRVLLIDVGGGLGHQAAEFRAAFPDMPGKVLNMDLPFAVEHAKTLPSPGVEHIAHDFFMPQPVKSMCPSSHSHVLNH
jgi:demethylsterigmatocystin 6-O-methyltransferase